MTEIEEVAKTTFGESGDTIGLGREQRKRRAYCWP